jgi:hypothetical protein
MALIFAKLLLIAGLVLCPFRCQLEVLSSVRSGGEEVAAARCCCSGCQQRGVEAAANTPGTPAPEDPADESCQCICSGAVVEKSDDVRLLDATHAAADLERHPAVLGERTTAADIRAPAQARMSLNTGRMLRTLHQSLLC